MHSNGGDRAVNESCAEQLHLALGLRRTHGAAEDIGGTRGEARNLNRDAHHLFLVQDHPERLVQDRRK